MTLLVLAAAAALAVSLGSAMATAVIGLVLFGILHTLLELRYVAGRSSRLFGRSYVELLLALVTGIVISRLLLGLVGRPAQLVEVILGYTVLALAVHRVLRGWPRRVAWGLLAPAALASLVWPAQYLFVLGQLHHLVPLVFLWDWSTRLPAGRVRTGFRLTQLLWLVAVPAVILSGLVDGWLAADPGGVRSLVGDGQSVLAASAPPGTTSGVAELRFLTVLAFLQTMHYVIWIWFLPRYAPDVTAAFEARVPWLTGARVWAIGFVAAALFAVLFVSDYGQGKAVYSALASYHVYLELPVLVALLARVNRVAPRKPVSPVVMSRPAPPTRQAVS